MRKRFHSYFFIFFLTFFSLYGHTQNNRDTAQCNNHYSPVIGRDHHCYLNTCWANKFSDSIISDSIPPDSIWEKQYQEEDDPYTWYIYHICEPIHRNEILKDLSDGTYIYKHWETGKLFRSNKNTCKCLTSACKIRTIHGYREVEELTIGDSIATIDNGDTIFLPIIQTNKIAVEQEKHIICNIEFLNGIKISVSSEHPASDYKSEIGSLKPGDILNGLVVTSIEKTINKEKFTYDILPAGSTGTYWVNGVLLGSTLFDQLSTAKVSY